MEKLCRHLQQYGPLAARILLAQLFIVSGFAKITGFAKTADFMAKVGLPAPVILLVLTIALEIGGGILLALGWRARWVAAAMCGFTFLTAMLIHPFWSVDPAAFSAHLNNFMKNLAIMGGMIYVMAYGGGPYSLGGDACATAQGGDRKP